MVGRVTMSDVAREADVANPFFQVAHSTEHAAHANGYSVFLCNIGFDDVLPAALVTPPLTTCRMPRYELGQQVMRLLSDWINSSKLVDAVQERQGIVLQPQLVVRASAP